MTDHLPPATAPPDSQPLLTLEGLGFARGAQTILSRINMAFHPGRHYILAGPNGAGKSTILDLLAGLLKPLEGRVLLNGLSVGAWPKRKLARFMSLAPQDYRMKFPFSVREVVSLGRRPYLGRLGYLRPEDHQVVDRALELTDLKTLAHKPVTNLSGGERQRTVLARALAQDTPILLLDEPTASLDVAHALKVMKLARQSARQGRLVITVTHDLALAAAYGQEFIFLKNGRLAAAGAAAEVLTAEILAQVYEVEAQVNYEPFVGGPTVLFKEKEA